MKKSLAKLGNFIKRNALYLILAFCVLAVGLSATYMIVKDMGGGDITVDAPVDEEETPDTPDTPTVITFISPLDNPASIEAYSEAMVWCSTMNRYTAHVGIDYFAPEGTPVKAVYGGIVESVETDLVRGVTVTIDHGNGLKTIYNSLADADSISVGAEVNAGDVIGHVSVSNRTEYKKGAHLHFETLENGEKIDPEKYFLEEGK